MPLSAEQFLTDSAMEKYRPSVIGNTMQQWIDGQRGWFTWRDVEAMRRDPDISFGINVWHGPMSKVKWTVTSQTPGVQEYVDTQLSRFWQNDRIKPLRMLEYASAAGAIKWKLEAGLIIYDTLIEFHMADVRPLQRGCEFAGIQLNQGEGKIYMPRAFWVADHPEFGSLYGSRPRLAGAYQPWRESNGRHGANDIRRLWYLKNAFRGGTIWHPMGNVQLEDGVVMAYGDYAREIVEKAETGGVMAFPNTRDAQGNKLWEHEPPKPNGDITGVRDYTKDLSEEKWIGMGIPVEVIKATQTGAWAGRTIPFLVFLSSMDEIASTIIRAFDRCGLKHAVQFNFGEAAKYEIELASLTSLADVDPAQQPNGQEGEEEEYQDDSRYESYVGKKGSRKGQSGRRDPTSGRIIYDDVGLSQPHPIVIDSNIRRKAAKKAMERFPIMLGWEAYVGQRGRRKGHPGWKNTDTGRIVFGERPEDRPQTSPDEMKSRLQEVYSREPTAEAAQDLIRSLSSLKVSEIKELAKSFGIRAGGPKAERARKVVAAISKRITAGEQLRRDVRAAGGNREDARQISMAAQFYRKADNETIDEINRCISYARELISKDIGKRLTSKHPFFDGGDYTSIPSYDQITTSVCSEFKSLFPAAGAGDEYEDDKDKIEKLFEMVKAGKLARTNLETTRKQAFEEWQQQRKLTDNETVPFSHSAG